MINKIVEKKKTEKHNNIYGKKVGVA